MSTYHSTSTTGQQNATTGGSSAGNGLQATTAARNDLNLDYLASAYASNGTIPQAILHAGAANASNAQNSAEFMNALLMAASSGGAMDPLTASTLFCKLTRFLYLFDL